MQFSRPHYGVAQHIAHSGTTKPIQSLLQTIAQAEDRADLSAAEKSCPPPVPPKPILGESIEEDCQASAYWVFDPITPEEAEQEDLRMMKALQVIANLNPDDKLVVVSDRCLQVDESYWRSLSRYLRGQGRGVMIQFLEELVAWCRFKMICYRLVKKPAPLSGLVEFHLQLGAALLKYHLLQETYQADPETSASLQAIKEHLESVESILLEIRAAIHKNET